MLWTKLIGVAPKASRKRSANTEAHLREFLEQGSEVVADGTAAAIHPELGDGYQTVLTNFRFIANSVMGTEEAVSAM